MPEQLLPAVGFTWRQTVNKTIEGMVLKLSHLISRSKTVKYVCFDEKRSPEPAVESRLLAAK
ncbi:MAG: hypothetical protein SRB2_03086 [Desulfobacteraceae bacterium Eth-SRB2]|nr:MAG: hypothetical protein SRB2_03086 [Desulfobacteraceae bacterium Eth-SRB2]